MSLFANLSITFLVSNTNKSLWPLWSHSIWTQNVPATTSNVYLSYWNYCIGAQDRAISRRDRIPGNFNLSLCSPYQQYEMGKVFSPTLLHLWSGDTSSTSPLSDLLNEWVTLPIVCVITISALELLCIWLMKGALKSLSAKALLQGVRLNRSEMGPRKLQSLWFRCTARGESSICVFTWDLRGRQGVPAQHGRVWSTQLEI